MALKGLNRHQQRVLRDSIRREHPNKTKLTKEQREARRERLEFQQKKERERNE